MHKKWIYRFSSFLVILTILISPVLASVSTPISFSKIKVWDIDNTWHNTGGFVVIPDATDFLTMITTAYGVNQDFRSVCTNVPYSVVNVTIQDASGNNFSGQSIAFRSGTYERRSGSPATFVGSYYIGSGASFTYNSYFFTDAFSYSTSHATYYLPKNENGQFILFDNSVDPDMDSIITMLDSISTYCYGINSKMGTNNTTLSSILSAINTSNSSLSTIATRLSTINTSLGTINNTLGVINNRLITTNATLSDIDSILYDTYNYLNDQLEIMGDSLDSIDTNLVYFSNQFQIYSSTVLSHLDNIDQNLQEIHDEMSGEALKDYNVTPHGGGSSINLWQVIKMGVSGGMSAIGNFFNMLLESVGLFGGGSATGFDILYDVTQASETYNPTDLISGVGAGGVYQGGINGG